MIQNIFLSDRPPTRTPGLIESDVERENRSECHVGRRFTQQRTGLLGRFVLRDSATPFNAGKSFLMESLGMNSTRKLATWTKQASRSISSDIGLGLRRVGVVLAHPPPFWTGSTARWVSGRTPVFAAQDTSDCEGHR
jgi:hypothetical protein